MEVLSSALDSGDSAGVVVHVDMCVLVNDFIGRAKVTVQCKGEICDVHFIHTPLSEFGDVLIKTMMNRIRRCEGKRICACWCTALRYLCESVQVFVHKLLTRVCSSHFAVTSQGLKPYSRATVMVKV